LSAAVLSGIAVAATSRAIAPPAGPVLAFADEKHDHKEGEHKGEKKDLGKKKIGDYEVQVTQVGDVTPGKEAIFIVKLTGAAAKPKAVRGWVGIESGKGAIKTKAEDEEKEYHLHHEVAKPLPEKNKLWIELETAAGKKAGSFDHSPPSDKKHPH
jgi:hypothetical protein